MNDLKHLLLHVVEATDESHLLDSILEFGNEFKSTGCEEAKEKLVVACQSLIMKSMMQSQEKSAEDIISDIEKFEKANRLFKFESN